MQTTTLGYNRDLFILPFDHRSSFEAGLLGIRDRPADPQEVHQLAGYKRIIYDGFLQALETGVPPNNAAILVDQKYGEDLLADANQRGITTCTSVEKSGQAEFDFEYGEDFGRRLNDAKPTFAKALVRYNPEGEDSANENQRRRLRVLSEFARPSGYKFMLELLVPATEAQLNGVGHDVRSYDLDLRPNLVVQAVRELQDAGVEPDVWKLEGMDEPDAARCLVSQVQADGREKVGVIVLGRGENQKRVDHWISIGGGTPGVIGFAVGRTVFWQPVVEHQNGAISRTQAVDRIAGAYGRLYHHFIAAR